MHGACRPNALTFTFCSLFLTFVKHREHLSADKGILGSQCFKAKASGLKIYMVNNLTAALLCSHILYFNIVHIPFKWSLLTYIYVSFYQIIEKNEIVQETWSTETIVITSRHIQIKFKLLFWSAKSRFYYYNIFWSLRQTVDSHTYKKEIKWGKRKNNFICTSFFFLAQCKKKFFSVILVAFLSSALISPLQLFSVCAPLHVESSSFPHPHRVRK